MPIRFYALLTWTTAQRRESIDAGAATFLRHFIPAAARRHGVRVLELGLVRDHVHVMLEFGGVVDIPRLVQALKGASARIANRDGIVSRKLRWAQGYDLRSISPRALTAVRAYVRRQSERHPERAIVE